MKEEFQIFKKGVTKHKVTVVSKTSEPFDRESKIKKYLSLGYQVFDMDNNEIK